MNELRCDVLVIGGGAAGSRAAYEAKRSHPQLEVTLVVAGKYGTSGSTNLIASESLGINAPFNYMGDGDDPDVYFQDMLDTGGGLSDPDLCRVIADEACTRVEELMALGLEFDSEAGHPVQRKLSGCTKARSLTCGGATGREIVRVLKKANISIGVQVIEDVRILDLVKDDNGRVCGAVGLNEKKPIFITARAVILATGGAGRIFRKNVNPPSIEGDGWAMAYRAGARLVNMEFFQVGPAVVKPKVQFIIHSHMWRLQPKLTNVHGEEFLKHYCPEGVEVAEVIEAKAMSYPFSVRTVAKYLDIAIFKELMAGRGTLDDGVYFDVTHVEEEVLKQRAPITYDFLKRAGVDLTREKIELGLVVQNFNGGILIDVNGFTGVEGLYAAGEVTGGVHGADRPGGNNLIDTQVFGYRAGRAAAEYALGQKEKSKLPVIVQDMSSELVKPVTEEEQVALQRSADLYYRELTIVRRAEGLRRVLDYISEHKPNNQNNILGNRLLVGQILALAALTREESRGTHYREDFPDSEPAWQQRIIISQGTNGEPAVTADKF
ncbi:FAD-dependent pyridine nucleotide-disulphide oxidoreductase [Moorella glycerini]|uniref:L-aspartate oxidase n=1 Tax=Neomoorella stamsii TaxID=1266720 RepID=A0A9X7P557_9FIRM|nr:MULTISPECIES: FAD-dependent oxidoreductase [Moorella]PRR70049.1 L-aspartate oxidase [Moorella stamsii]CEP68401.1 FAD-dependent pyridine nucleotide-disulphide oxidoreductase [Moorella glycerini]